MRKSEFLGHEITKLVVGDNMFTGHSYIEDIISAEELREYYDSKHLYEAYFKVEEAGYNCMIPLGDPFSLQMLYEYRRDGGKMKFIIQPYTNYQSPVPMFKALERIEPIAIYHQGTTSDFLIENGRESEIVETMSLYRTLGIPVGFCSHVPDRIKRCEKEGWGADFYMVCLQNARRGRQGEKSGFITGKTKSHLVFYPEDRPIALEAISEVQKPCIAYKIFAGGQAILGKTREETDRKIKNVYKEVFGKIKENDIACIGIHDGREDQSARDAALFEEAMLELEAEKAVGNGAEKATGR